MIPLIGILTRSYLPLNFPNYLVPMPNATGPWCHPPELPTDPKKLNLVLLEDRKFGRGFHVMRYLRNNWQFPEGLALSGNQKVICWAEINTEIPEPVRPVKAG